MSFPKDFVWGAATASYQIEGGRNAHGKGDSVWDMFCRKEGVVNNGENGDIACDHYNLFKEDVALFKDMGLQSYRFSLSWPRIMPKGDGEFNVLGMDFYDALVDNLLEKGIDPCVTLFHWDYPLSLYHRGGWMNPESSDWFAEYARLAVECLGDRVNNWITQNEPQCFVELGHNRAYHAPGDKLATKELLTVAHNSLLAHGKAYRAMKEVRPDLNVGYAPVGITYMPQDPTKDIDAARNRMFGHVDKGLFTNTWFMDPIFKGAYPEDGVKLYGADMPDIKEGDMEIINSGADFLGVNVYHGDYIKDDGSPYGAYATQPRGGQRTAMDWQITPEALYWGPKFLYERYKKPIVITENGMAGTDVVSSDGIVHDSYRIAYLEQYMANLKKAIAEGVDVTAYYLWSAMDNFEWEKGYDRRFGIVHVDYETLKRTPKDSARWYSEVIKTNGENL